MQNYIDDAYKMQANTQYARTPHIVIKSERETFMNFLPRRFCVCNGSMHIQHALRLNTIEFNGEYDG